MISDERLREAVRQAEEYLLASLPEPEDCEATFSPEFNSKMNVAMTERGFVWDIVRALDTEIESKQSSSTPVKGNVGEPYYEDSEPEIEVCYDDPNNPVAEQNYHVGEPRYEDSEPEIENR